MSIPKSLPRLGGHPARVACLVASVPLSVLLASCSGGGGTTPPPVVPPASTYAAISGVAQKGPLIKGSIVNAQELDSKLSPIGRQYSYQITTDLGAFSPASTFSSQYIGLNATGYYFDEVANAVSTGTITLNGYSDLSAVSVLNVNLLTTLAFQRIQHLVTASNMAFAEATVEAENEVLAALNIPVGSYGSFGSLDLGGSTDGDHILAAISSIFVYGNSAGPLSQLIANVQSDIGTNGAITSAATRSALTSAAKTLDPAAIAANLTQAYSSVGATFTAADISDWIDQDGDGVIGKFKFQVADATPSSVFTFPESIVNQIAGTSVSVTAGDLSVNDAPITGALIVQKGDVVTVSPGTGGFPNGVLTVYLMSAETKVARVSFVSNLLSLAVTPATPSVPKGSTQQFKATGTFSDSSTADLTDSVSWASGTPTVASVNATSGLAQTLSVGSTVVTATSGSVSGSATLTVTPTVLESIAITPDPAFAGIGIATQLKAAGTYSDGTVADVTIAANWISNAPDIATVGPTTGLAKGVSLGSTSIEATVGSIAGTASLSIVTDAWVPAGQVITPRNRHAVALLPNGSVLVVGGNNVTGSILSTAESYDPLANTWSPAGSMAEWRVFHTATLLPNGKVLVVGGHHGGSSATAEIFDPAATVWSPAASMWTGREAHTATLLPNGKVLVVGGLTNLGVTTGAELYDPATNAWTNVASMSTARTYHVAILLPNGKVLVAGGQNLPSSAALASAELYDPITDKWTPAGGMSNSRYRPTATLLPNGTVLVVGGYTAALISSASAEVYDPITNTWSPASSMSTARGDHTATLLPNGKLLVAGGEDTSHSLLASAELYDPSTNVWSAASSMMTARELHSATLLQNGKVLVRGEENSMQSSPELYW